jgi:Holliday junction resolvase RusA-like endonuclease
MKQARRVFVFDLKSGAVKLGRDHYALAKEPVFFVNKARTYTKIRGTGRRRAGGPEWEDLKRFEAAVRLTAARELERVDWSTSSRYSVEVELFFGAKRINSRSSKGKPFVRVDPGPVRLRRIGLDKATQAILDGMQGPVFTDDERVERLLISKALRPDGIVGDRALVTVVDLGLRSSLTAEPVEI